MHIFHPRRDRPAPKPPEPPISRHASHVSSFPNLRDIEESLNTEVEITSTDQPLPYHRRGFGRTNNNKSTNQSGKGNGSNLPSPTYQNSSSSLTPSIPPMPQSPALSAQMSFDNASGSDVNLPTNRRPPYFFREEYSGLIVKGNFMTLAAKPQHVDEGEWLAHQVVEQYRLLDTMIQIIKAVDDKTGLMVCSPETCPTMSASGHTYTWLDNKKNPIKIPACQYIQLVQKWINGKIMDSSLFPTDTSFSSSSTYPSGSPHSHTTSPNPTNPSTPGHTWLGAPSGFPESFETDIRSIYRQMMRCYAHMYHGHWLDPFWHIGAWKELNTCFIHFVNVGKSFDLIGDKEMQPMLPLVEIWGGKGLLPVPVGQGKGEGVGMAA
ncbi:Mob1/phocein [Aulographum hederae CBS 113979]|uniref:Mob1/phocein n=1 Tax=Aulographum hederae CBS 113979 TaxID=1176131 RepID=A0A6G1GQ80_9PEZI|nr:Mob1/phocein [Aulographum hederae CBS 113979]